MAGDVVNTNWTFTQNCCQGPTPLGERIFKGQKLEIYDLGMDQMDALDKV